MPAFTVQTLIDRAAAIADMTDNFVTPTQWLAWYNVEARALELFIARNGYVSSLATTADNSASYSITISDSTLAILGVYELRDGRYRALRFSNQVDSSQPSTNPVNGTAYEYVVVDSATGTGVTIDLVPKPTSGTYRCLYLKGTTPVTTVADTVYWPLGWEERIVLGMARRALIKEESNTKDIERLMVEQDAIIEEFCWSRSLGSAPRVRNTDGDERGWYRELPYGTYESWIWI